MTTVSGYYQLECEIRSLKEKAGWFDEMIEETKKCRLEGGKTVVGQVFVTLKQENKQLKELRDEDARIKHELRDEIELLKKVVILENQKLEKIEKERIRLREELKEITASCDLWYKDAQKYKKEVIYLRELNNGLNYKRGVGND